MSSNIRIPWDSLHATLNLEGGAEFGVNAAVAVTALPPIEATTMSTVALGLNDIRVQELNANTTSSVNLGLDNIRIKELNANTTSSVDLGLDDIRVKELNANTTSKVDLGLDNIRIQELPPVQLELAVRPFRLHLPVNFKFCVEVLGVVLFKFSVCGEGMAISEANEPRKTEKCQ